MLKIIKKNTYVCNLYTGFFLNICKILALALSIVPLSQSIIFIFSFLNKTNIFISFYLTCLFVPYFIIFPLFPLYFLLFIYFYKRRNYKIQLFLYFLALPLFKSILYFSESSHFDFGFSDFFFFVRDWQKYGFICYWSYNFLISLFIFLLPFVINFSNKNDSDH